MDLSILIPSRNEMFLARTIEDIIQHSEAQTEVIALLDGEWANPPIKQHPMVNVIYVPESIGQRAGTNLACKIAKGKYVMKVDAHCSFDQGFDRKMLEAFKEVGDNVTMVPTMRNLWAFDWKCHKCGWKGYQGPTPLFCPDCSSKCSCGHKNTPVEKPIVKSIGVCEACGKVLPLLSKEHIKRKMMWVGKEKPQSNSYCFDSTPHFQYFNDYTKRPGWGKDGPYVESMSLQGSCFMMTREKYWELNVCDEAFGSWGSQGIEVACKTWLSGGRVLVNRNTWYAHMFRTQGGDFSFPYNQRESKVQEAKRKAKDIFFNGKFEGQKLPLSWLVEKFWPVTGWTAEDLEKLKQLENAKK